MRIKLDFRKVWTISLVAYIICSTAFSYGTLRILNSVALYFFLGVSVLNILLRGRMQLDMVVGALIVYAVIMLLGILYTPTRTEMATEILYSFITMLIILFCITQYVESVADIKLIIYSFVVAGMALAIYVYAQYGNAFWDLLKQIAESENNNMDRLDGDLANANTISMCTMISAIIAGYQIIFGKEKKIVKIFYIAVAVFCLIISMAAASKKSLIILFVSIISIWLYSTWGSGNIAKSLRDLLILLAVLVVTIYLIGNIPIFASVLKRFENLFDFLQGGDGTGSEIGRFDMIQQGLEIWKENPILGAGTASSIYYFGVYSHSNPVELLMNSGLIGFVVFYAVYAVAGYRYLKNARAYKETSYIISLLFALFMSMTICGVAFVYYYERYTMILMVMAMSGLRIFEKQRRELAINE